MKQRPGNKPVPGQNKGNPKTRKVNPLYSDHFLQHRAHAGEMSRLAALVLAENNSFTGTSLTRN